MNVTLSAESAIERIRSRILSAGLNPDDFPLDDPRALQMKLKAVGLLPQQQQEVTMTNSNPNSNPISTMKSHVIVPLSLPPPAHSRSQLLTLLEPLHMDHEVSFNALLTRLYEHYPLPFRLESMPLFYGKKLLLFPLFQKCQSMGGCLQVERQQQWPLLLMQLGVMAATTPLHVMQQAAKVLQHLVMQYLYPLEVVLFHPHHYPDPVENQSPPLNATCLVKMLHQLESQQKVYASEWAMSLKGCTRKSVRPALKKEDLGAMDCGALVLMLSSSLEQSRIEALNVLTVLLMDPTAGVPVSYVSLILDALLEWIQDYQCHRTIEREEPSCLYDLLYEEEMTRQALFHPSCLEDELVPNSLLFTMFQDDPSFKRNLKEEMWHCLVLVLAGFSFGSLEVRRVLLGNGKYLEFMLNGLSLKREDEKYPTLHYHKQSLLIWSHLAVLGYLPPVSLQSESMQLCLAYLKRALLDWQQASRCHLAETRMPLVDWTCLSPVWCCLEIILYWGWKRRDVVTALPIHTLIPCLLEMARVLVVHITQRLHHQASLAISDTLVLDTILSALEAWTRDDASPHPLPPHSLSSLLQLIQIWPPLLDVTSPSDLHYFDDTLDKSLLPSTKATLYGIHFRYWKCVECLVKKKWEIRYEERLKTLQLVHVALRWIPVWDGLLRNVLQSILFQIMDTMEI